jgi:hypothetical protein
MPTEKCLGRLGAKFLPSPLLKNCPRGPKFRGELMFCTHCLQMTKCTFYKFGGSGTIQRFDSLCVLSMNIVNEKIYIFLWFWFIILETIL